MQKKKRVVALGFFDGVHIGHGALLRKTRECAEILGVTPSVMTYSRHPSEIVGKSPVLLINTTTERCELISELYGIDDIVIKDFTKEYASLSCEEFFEEIIIKELNAVCVVAGFDFRFGKGGAGDHDMLASLCARHGIGCEIVDAVMSGGEAVSSSRVRKLLADGDISSATKLLGHNHCIISEVVHGRHLGSEIGFPTVNQILEENIQLPKLGVYLSEVSVNGNKYRGVTNIGVRPTVSEKNVARAETHILDFEGNLYGETVKVGLISFMRGEMRFDSVAALREQIARDAESARRF